MGWLIGFAILFAILLLPIGVRFIYRESQSGAWVLIGPVRFLVYPKQKHEEKNPTHHKSDNPKGEKGGSYREFLPIIRTIIAFLEELRRKIRVRRLELKMILAGDDPSDLAVNYGRAWAALGNLMPQLERFLVIKKRNIEVECDFTAEETLIYARVDATISLIRLLHLLLRHGIKLLKQFVDLNKIRKGGAQL